MFCILATCTISLLSLFNYTDTLLPIQIQLDSTRVGDLCSSTSMHHPLPLVQELGLDFGCPKVY